MGLKWEDKESLTENEPPMFVSAEYNRKMKKSAPWLFICLSIAFILVLGLTSWKFISIRTLQPIYVYVENNIIDISMGAKPKTKEEFVCSDIPDSQKFDCTPDLPIQEDRCLNRGCCWKSVSQNYSGISFPPLDVPYCYFPSDYVGYKIVNTSSTGRGEMVILQRISASGFPNDIALLNLTLTVLDESRFRIKITDYYSERFEVPLSRRDTRKEVNGSVSYDYRVTPDGLLSVKRKSNGNVIFSTDLKRLVYADQFLQLSSVLPSANIYGIGEQYGPLLRNVNWTRTTLFNRDMYPVANMNYYGSHPFYICLENDGNSHGVLLLNSNSMDIILQPMPAVTFRTIGGILDFYIFLGPSPDFVVQQYSQVVGNPFMPPYWSLGFHLCRFGYNSLNETRKVWQRTRDAGIPFDVQWNDIDYMNKYNDFTYDKVNFEGLPEFVKELHESGMRYVIMVDPGVSGAEPPGTYPPYDEGLKADIFIKNSSGQVFIGKVWNLVSTVFPDFSHPNSQSYWVKLFKDFHAEVPFDGAWIDMNEISNFYDGQIDGCPKNSSLENPPYIPGGLEPLRSKTLCMTAKHYIAPHYDEHNLHAFREAVATAVALLKTTGKRPFLISRATTSGLGAYGGHWSGDIASSWEDMRYSIRSLLAFNIFGIPMMGSDICGFRDNTTEELCARWSALGAFYPFSRNHNDKSQKDQDPVALGPIVTSAAKKALWKRYALLPYLYTLFYRSHAFGETVVRPLFFEYPQDVKSYALEQTFLWGPAILVIPVLYPGVENVTAYFPKDLWYNSSSGEQIQSLGQEFTLPAPITEINIYVRGGYILPMQYPGLTTTESRHNPFQLFAAMDFNQEACGELFWDDGESFGTLVNKQYNLIKFSLKNKTLSTETVVTGYSTPMILRRIVICSLLSKPTSVTVNGIESSFIFDEQSKCLRVQGIQRSLLDANEIIWM